jgi:DNA topoisomerase-6 subunit B
LVEALCRITKAPDSRKKKAEEGLLKLLGRDATEVKKELKDAHAKLEAHQDKLDDKKSDQLNEEEEEANA